MSSILLIQCDILHGANCLDLSQDRGASRVVAQNKNEVAQQKTKKLERFESFNPYVRCHIR